MYTTGSRRRGLLQVYVRDLLRYIKCTKYMCLCILPKCTEYRWCLICAWEHGMGEHRKVKGVHMFPLAWKERLHGSIDAWAVCWDQLPVHFLLWYWWMTSTVFSSNKYILLFLKIIYEKQIFMRISQSWNPKTLPSLILQCLTRSDRL